MRSRKTPGINLFLRPAGFLFAAGGFYPKAYWFLQVVFYNLIYYHAKNKGIEENTASCFRNHTTRMNVLCG